MKALVTGGAGFIGSHLSERLLAQGADVVAVDCFTDYYPRAHQGAEPVRRCSGRPNYRFVEGELARVDLPRACWTASRTCFTSRRRPGSARAGAATSRPTRRSTSTRRRSCSRPASAAQSSGSCMPRARRSTATRWRCRCARMPCRSPVSPYGVTKLAAEHLCNLYFVNHGVPTVSLRYFTVYGPRQRPDMGFHRFFTAVLEDRPVVQFGDGLQTRDFTFVADAVAATAAAAVRGAPGGVYNIGGGSRVTLREVFDMIGRVTGRPLRIDHQPEQKGDMRDTYAETSRAQADLGFAPSVSLEEGLTRDVRLDGIRSLMTRRAVAFFSPLALSAAACGGAASRSQIPPGTAEADKFLFTRGEEEFKERNWLRAREYYRQIVDNYPQSSFRPDAKLGRRRHVHWRGHDRIADPRRQRVPRVPDLLPDQPACRLRAVPARRRLLAADARGRPRSVGDPRRHQGTAGLPRPLSEQPADARGEEADARGQGPPQRIELSDRVHLLPHEVVRRGDRSVQGSAGSGSAGTRIATRSTSISPSRSGSSTRLARESRKRCPTTNACSRSSSRASTSRTRRSGSASSKPSSKPHPRLALASGRAA